MLRIALVLSCLVAVEHRAHAIAACGNGEGWALASGSTVPVHPHLVYYLDGRRGSVPPTPTATIDGKPVTVKMTTASAPPFQLVVLDIDSAKTGNLVISFGGATAANNYFAAEDATYKVSGKLKLPAEAKGMAARFHQAYRHSTVHELDDGLEVRVDVPAVAFTARWRSDPKAAWTTLEMTAMTIGGQQAARLGSLGCSANFQTPVLEKGIDLELDAILADGKRVKVTGLPAHYVLPALPKDAPQSHP